MVCLLYCFSLFTALFCFTYCFRFALFALLCQMAGDVGIFHTLAVFVAVVEVLMAVVVVVVVVVVAVTMVGW